MQQPRVSGCVLFWWDNLAFARGTGLHWGVGWHKPRGDKDNLFHRARGEESAGKRMWVQWVTCIYNDGPQGAPTQGHIPSSFCFPDAWAPSITTPNTLSGLAAPG